MIGTSETTPPGVGGLRAARLLVRLRLRQQVNRIVSVYRHRWGRKTRTGTARKMRAGWLIGLWVGVSMVIAIGQISYNSVVNVERAMRVAEARASLQHPTVARNPDPDAGRATRAPASGNPERIGGRSARAAPALRYPGPAPGYAWPTGAIRGATFLASLAILAALFLTLASREIVRTEWELEWLVTMPLAATTLIACRIAERAFTNFGAMIAMTPILGVMAWRCGHTWTAPLYAIALTIPLLLFVASVHTLVDTGLRLALAPSRLRNLHAVVSILSPLPLLLVISASLPDNLLVAGWAGATPDWVAWLPGGLAVRALAATDVGAAAQWFGLMTGELVGLIAASFLLIERQMRRGVVAVGVREAAVRRPAGAAHPAVPAAGGLAARLFSPVQRRELRLLSRDHSFMAQTLVLPLITVGVQIFLNVHTNILATAIDRPANLAAIAFGLAAYTLLYSAFQTLNTEGQALWILYSVPQPLESVLRSKAKLWAVLAIAYPLAIFAIAIVLARDISLPFVGAAVVVGAGVPIFSVIATALGVFGCDPLEQDVQKRVRPTYLYIYMLLASFYAYAIYASSMWQRAALVVLTGLVALALWQKARDRFPYLLDPTASPPARVSLADGLIAALMFFVLQALIGLVERPFGNGHTMTPAMVWIAYSGAGAITYGVMRLTYWRAGTTDLPRLIGPGLARAALLGVAGGLAAAIFGFAYVMAARSFEWFPAFRQSTATPDLATMLWLGALAVVAAPIFEEFIFRGLIFGGMRRTLGTAGAVLASAAIFAIVHPPVSVVPVFVLGLCTAVVYARTRMLAASMITHALYNAAVIALQWNVLQHAV
ncbi:MAG TPA: type II CAAX endopeptidase family protein [Xanthobacteraceae bacterium]|nr:type II CAAX endopeptidase family protein [Xanthobacteraceae bacterium]